MQGDRELTLSLLKADAVFILLLHREARGDSSLDWLNLASTAALPMNTHHLHLCESVGKKNIGDRGTSRGLCAGQGAYEALGKARQ